MSFACSEKGRPCAVQPGVLKSSARHHALVFLRRRKRFWGIPQSDAEACLILSNAVPEEIQCTYPGVHLEIDAKCQSQSLYLISRMSILPASSTWTMTAK